MTRDKSKSSTMRIADREIGPGRDPFIVAEVGINHNGDAGMARKMIAVAKESGADAVKFQTFKSEEFVGDPEVTYTYRSQGMEVTEPMGDMFKRYEFSAGVWK